MSPATAQAIQALANANAIRSARSLILQPLRRGEAVIGDVDLDAPELASMRLLDFLASLRYKRTKGTPAYKSPANHRATKIVGLLGCNGNRRLGDLTARQKAELVRIVEEQSVAQRRES